MQKLKKTIKNCQILDRKKSDEKNILCLKTNNLDVGILLE